MSVTNNHIDYQQHNTGQQASGDSMASPSPNNATLGTSNTTGISKGNSASSAGGSSGGGGSSSGSDGTTQLLTKPRLQELVREIDPTEQLDEEVEELLLQIADDFVENTVNAACLLAKHRKVPKVEVRDVQLHLERNWNMWIPGFGTDELRPYKRATVTEAHKQRLALIRKAIKKY
ncbi:transcription initiation factor TFIID subunit 12 [Anopheles darlingi]|uniref:Transcription initiation factor TFIID subunit 12 n=1 Tax=Anopheles darlingi TaxID=43151 RepID=W5JAT7_ANODA|nr:transcription initiation factor TFIID subunit 12 [Anopheles darlingi]